jgi:hypothetical protein
MSPLQGHFMGASRINEQVAATRDRDASELTPPDCHQSSIAFALWTIAQQLDEMNAITLRSNIRADLELLEALERLLSNDDITNRQLAQALVNKLRGVV